MYPAVSFQKNLHLPESGLNFALNIFLENSGLIYLFDPLEFNSSCNIPLLKKIDNSKETLGKVSYLPLAFLHDYLLSKQLLPYPENYSSDLERKIAYINIAKKNNLFDNESLQKISYKNVPLTCLRKSILFSVLSQTVDACKIDINTGDNVLTDFNILKIPLLPINDVVVRNQNEWLNKNDLSNIIYPNLFSLPKNTLEEICFIPLIFLKTPFYTIDLTYSDILHSFKWDEIPTNKRFILFFILYKSHFTSVIIDQAVPRKDKIKKKFAYFFNSTGYNPDNFKLNKNYWFIDNSFKIINHGSMKYDYCNDNNYMMPIEALALILKDKFNINNFVFNTFSLQNFDSECGIFSSVFLYTFINLLKSRNNLEEINITKIKHLYFNMLTLGCDLTYSMFRGLLYFTQEDLKLNKLNESEYLNSVDVYEIKNKKFYEYIQIFFKNIIFIENIYNRIKKIKTTLKEKYLLNLVFDNKFKNESA